MHHLPIFLPHSGSFFMITFCHSVNISFKVGVQSLFDCLDFCSSVTCDKNYLKSLLLPFSFRVSAAPAVVWQMQFIDWTGQLCSVPRWSLTMPNMCWNVIKGNFIITYRGMLQDYLSFDSLVMIHSFISQFSLLNLNYWRGDKNA